MRIAFVCREFHPLCGGGIGVQLAGACEALAPIAEITVLTTSRWAERYRELLEAGDPRLPRDVRFEFVEEPAAGEFGSYYGFLHLYSARVLDRLRELYPDGAPDLIEFADFLGEGLVCVQARRANEDFLRLSTVCVRLHTSAEMCSVLDGHVDDGFESRMLISGERHALRYADRVLAPGGDVLDTYRRFYGDDALAPAVNIPPIVPPAPRRNTPPEVPAADHVRFLYMGRLERRKGVQDLIRAFTGLRRENWLLTLAGGDTDTAPLGLSMRDQLMLAAAEHPQIVFLEDLPREQVPRLVDDHHVVVCPSRWECWPSVALEGLGGNRPVLGTPTGGMAEMLADPEAGWLAGGNGAMALLDQIDRVLESPHEVDRLIASGGPRRVHERLNDPAALRSRYEELVRDTKRGSQNRRALSTVHEPPPLVSVIVPYYRMDRYLEDTIRSVYTQDYPRLEVIVVNDGSLRPEDEILAKLSTRYPIRVMTQENAGLGSARNAGIAHSRGRFVLPVDADNMLAPNFVSRCVEILEHEPDVPFVTTWSRYVDEEGRPLEGLGAGYQPIGNSSAAVLYDNVAGDGTAVMRRSLFDQGFRYSPDLTSYEDWQLYRELHAAGLFGVVVPERLLQYRVRADSMLREVGLQLAGRLYGEMQAELREREVEWQSKSASASRQ